MIRSSEPSAQWKVTIPKRIAARVELRLIDPRTGRPMYAARARLLEVLLNDFLENETYQQEVLGRMDEDTEQDLDTEQVE